MGEGASITELGPFDRKMEDKQAVWEDAVRCIVPMFTHEGWEYDGPYFKFPLRNVLPKPAQKPHPPLWVACSQLDTIVYAAHRGMGALCFKFVDLAAAEAWVNAYYNTFVHNQQRLTDYQANPNIAVVGGFMCCETDEEAQQRSDGWTFFQFTLQLYNAEGPFEPGTMNFWERYQEWKKTPQGQRRTENELIGTPATVRKRLLELEKANVDQVILLNQAGKNSHQDICSSLELFAREVMPEFHDRETEHQAWKRSVLAGETTLRIVDTEAFNMAGRLRPTQPPSDEAQRVKEQIEARIAAAESGGTASAAAGS
jgi:alkanesulfonate monooxygenase SsuD/methylene tetrahydromethanopterin reductase-like flavin-dependent oxidoreductase (luciferase family)